MSHPIPTQEYRALEDSCTCKRVPLAVAQVGATSMYDMTTVLVKPSYHGDDCPRFSDYSHANLDDQEGSFIF